MKATGMSALKVDRILAALKAIVDRKSNPTLGRILVVKKVAVPAEKENVKCADPHFSQSGEFTCEGEQKLRIALKATFV